MARGRFRATGLRPNDAMSHTWDNAHGTGIPNYPGELLRQHPFNHTDSVMDFGCGTGSARPFLRDLMGVDSVVGVDISAKLLDVATGMYARSVRSDGAAHRFSR